MHRARALWLLAAGVAQALTLSAAAQSSGAPLTDEAPLQITAALHVHSSATSGEEDLVALARRARQAGIDALVLAENLGYEFRYAPAPLRYFFEARVRTPTLETYGIDRYLAELERARASADGILLIAGVEAPPYYYWSGSLIANDLTLNDMQRNVLVIAPQGNDERTATADLWRHLPAVGNRDHRAWGLRSLGLVLPGLLAVGLALRRLIRRPLEPRRPGAVFAVLALIGGAALLWANYPYSAALMDPYDAEAGHVPVERLFEYVRQRGGLTFWSMPEAVDYHERTVGPIDVSLATAPYPSAIADTRGYTGFGGVYADTVTMLQPGAEWDVALQQFQAGARDAAPWVVGESAYHYAGQAGKQLDDILTVMLVDERTRAGVFAALARGRSYAVRRQQGSPDLRLQEFALVASGTGAAGTAPAPARMGDTLTLVGDGALPFDLVMAVDDLAPAADGQSGRAGTAVTVEVVRDGQLLRRFEGTTPLRERWTETLPAGLPASYLRIVVRAERPAYLVSNPVFVRRSDTAVATHQPQRAR